MVQFSLNEKLDQHLGFAGTWNNDLHFGMLMYPDLRETCIDFGHGLLIFLILVKWFKLWVSGPFYPAALKAPGYCRTPSGRAGGRTGGRQGRQAPLTLSRP